MNFTNYFIAVIVLTPTVLAQQLHLPIVNQAFDTTAFITTLKSTSHLEVDTSLRRYPDIHEQITAFQVLRILGSTQPYYLVEYSWGSGPMVAYPWKCQFLIDSNGRICRRLWALHWRLLSVQPSSLPYLVTVESTSRGNGCHIIYRILNDTLSVVLSSFLQQPQTYDIGEDNKINDPPELQLLLQDCNGDGFADIVFEGDLLQSDNPWTFISESQNVSRTHIRSVYLFDPRTGHFNPDDGSVANETKE